ncbi:hypothetical protein [uncultured Chryseobacterium sp.]|uniref:hypothetical protein n=1 Tax=uncultured Chryseobacterium sp. TaxID=259322 RepID=UPI002628EC37|nr:hypothetical protein [uncultured Chryseobacterium sp.]
MRLKELQTILDSQPSVSGSTFLVGALYVASWILFVAFLILGIGLLLESLFHFKIFLDWVSRQLNVLLNEDQRWKIATSFGLISVMLSAVFLGVIFLCRMVLNRNRFIIEMDEWIYTNITEVKRKAASKSKKL